MLNTLGKRIAIVGASGVMLVLATTAQAQPPGRGPGPSRSAGPSGFQMDAGKIFDRIDSDNNGQITKAEFVKAHARLQAMHRGGMRGGPPTTQRGPAAAPSQQRMRQRTQQSGRAMQARQHRGPGAMHRWSPRTGRRGRLGPHQPGFRGGSFPGPKPPMMGGPQRHSGRPTPHVGRRPEGPKSGPAARGPAARGPKPTGRTPRPATGPARKACGPDCQGDCPACNAKRDAIKKKAATRDRAAEQPKREPRPETARKAPTRDNAPAARGGERGDRPTPPWAGSRGDHPTPPWAGMGRDGDRPGPPGMGRPMMGGGPGGGDRPAGPMFGGHRGPPSRPPLDSDPEDKPDSDE